MEIKNNQVVRSKEEHLINSLAFGVAVRIIADMLGVDLNTANNIIVNEAQEELKLIKTKPGTIDQMINEQLDLQKTSPGKFVIELDREILNQ